MDYREIIIDIRRIVRSINLESKRIQRDFGISIPQLLALVYLRRQAAYQSTHKELTGHLTLNSSTVTGILNRLEKKGLIARLPNPEDKRVTRVALTARGLETIDNAPDLLQETLSRNLQKITPDEVQKIHEALQLLTQALGAEGLDASPILVVEDPGAPAD